MPEPTDDEKADYGDAPTPHEDAELGDETDDDELVRDLPQVDPDDTDPDDDEVAVAPV